MLRLGENGNANANKSINFNKKIFYPFYEIATNLFLCNFEIKARDACYSAFRPCSLSLFPS